MSATFTDHLDQIAEHSDRLRTAVAAADTELRVPGCPEWTLRDLVVHVGQVQRSWAAHVREVDRAPFTDVQDVDLLKWSAASTDALIDALRVAGPEAPCWTWWEESDAPSNAGAVARHQAQEAALHAYDAQNAVGQPRELPSDIAIDCVDEFLVVSLGAMGAWPHEDARVDFAADEGPRWTVRLTTAAKVEADPSDVPAATVTGPAADLILALYSRIPPEGLHVDGDRKVVEQLLNWAKMST